MKLAQLNIAEESEALYFLLQCCACRSWALQVLQKRPYDSLQTLIGISQAVWETLNESDYMEAFAAHPKIGELKAETKQDPISSSLSATEQSSVRKASGEALQQLASKNEAYFDKFGFIFIVCATGKTANEMLHILETRIENSIQEEIKIAATEQAKITLLRMQKLIE